MTILVSSSAFVEEGFIPAKYTCEGEDVSPSLRWSDPPSGTRSIALICDDPDAPGGACVHWVLYGLPPSVTELPEAILTKEILPSGARQGINPIVIATHGRSGVSLWFLGSTADRISRSSCVPGV